MIIGYNFYGEKDNLIYKTDVYHPSYDKIALQNLTIDELFVDEDITIPCTTNKPTGWNYRTVINAKFQNSLEGGSIQANNFRIEKIQIQRREVDEVEWQSIGEIIYNPNKRTLYELIDKNIQNNFKYQYSLLPVAASVLGNRITSKEILADFEGVFISDKNNNYRLLYNINTNPIQHNMSNTTFEPLNAQFPIIVDGNLNYRSGGIKALFISTETSNKNGKINIKSEKLSRSRLMNFLKNKKPKVLRQDNGEIMLIRIVGSPQEEHVDNLSGIAYINFNFVEIGNMDSETLKANDILISVGDEFNE